MTNYALCRLTVTFVWFYHGLIPKLLGPHEDELAMNLAVGVSHAGAVRIATEGGIFEIIFSLAVVFFWRHRWPLLVSALAMIVLLPFSIAAVPSLALAAFNPVTTNLCALVLSVVAWRLQKEAQSKPLPSHHH